MHIESQNILSWWAHPHHEVKLLSLYRTPQESPLCLRVLSKHFLHTWIQAWYCDHCPGKPVWCLTTLWDKNLLLLSSLILPDTAIASPSNLVTGHNSEEIVPAPPMLLKTMLKSSVRSPLQSPVFQVEQAKCLRCAKPDHQPQPELTYKMKPGHYVIDTVHII